MIAVQRMEALLAICNLIIEIGGEKINKLNNSAKVEHDMSMKDYCWLGIISTTNRVLMQLIFNAYK